MLKILGRLSSVNVQKVVWAAGETGQAFERIDIGGPFGGNREPAYLAKNPNGQVPVLEDGDVHIWESNAIVRYIAARYGRDTIWEEDPARRSEGDRWMDWALGELQRVMVPAFWGLMREPATADPAAIASSISRTEHCLDILEAHLENGFSYVGSDRFGMAEIVLGPSVHRWLNMPVGRIQRPRLQSWYEAISAREAARAALPLPIA
jgi:glutathione S-transferase